jgi:hypothetical protein
MMQKPRFFRVTLVFSVIIGPPFGTQLAYTRKTWAAWGNLGGGPFKPGFGLSGDVHTSQSRGRSSRNQSSNHMAFPHPQSRKNHHRNEDKPGRGCIVWKSFKRTVDITEYRNAKDDVNPANDRTLGGISHDWIYPPAIVPARPSAIHGTPSRHSKIPRRCDTRKPCRSDDRKRGRRRVF